MSATCENVEAPIKSDALIGHFRPLENTMGHWDLDPAVHERRPWNAGQKMWDLSAL